MSPPEYERVLTRLAEEWNRCRSGRPGFNWVKGRRFCDHIKAKEWLNHPYNWDPSSSGKEIYGAFLSAIENAGAHPQEFDSWDVPDGWVPTSEKGKCPQKAGDARQRKASSVRKATAPAFNLFGSGPAPHQEAKGKGISPSDKGKGISPFEKNKGKGISPPEEKC
jgi:hypothetical protein